MVWYYLPPKNRQEEASVDLPHFLAFAVEQ
jgi:hypothetical protein